VAAVAVRRMVDIHGVSPPYRWSFTVA
jgi:hypothetical protein